MAKRGNRKNTKTQNRNTNTTEQRSNKKELATVAIESVKQMVNILKPYELSESQRLRTFQLMLLDDAVGSAFSANSVFIEKAFANYHIEYDNNSEASTKAMEFLKWNLNHLDNQTVRSIARSAAEFKRDGLAPFEKVFERGFGEWGEVPSGAKAWKLKKLNYIHPLTLYEREPFKITNGGRTIECMNQKNNALKNSVSEKSVNLSGKGSIFTSVPMSKVVLMTYSSTDAQPFGATPFEMCYTAWREKVLLQDLTSVGVSKDLSGTPILTLPATILNDAAADPSSSAALMVEQLKESMANLHTGDQASIILPSDTFSETGNGAREYDVRFIGIDGGGKQFDLEALVEQRKKAIYNVFGAANLIAADSSGGYNQLEGQSNLHKHFIDRDISVIEEAWNNNLIPQLFRLNEWELTFDEIPKLKAGNITPNSMDEVSKMAQRLGAVGLLPKNVEVVNELLRKVGFKFQLPKDITQEELGNILTDFTSRSGDGMASGLPSGTGDSLGNNSATNSENKA